MNTPGPKATSATNKGSSHGESASWRGIVRKKDVITHIAGGMKKHLPWRLGIVIPCFLIAFIGITTLRYILCDDSSKEIIVFLVSYVMVWVSYVQAVWTSPGRVVPELCGQADALDAWCAKCQAPKPERAHHCKQCGRCVLKMDHHCPWTVNCVGHANLPHFLRFLTYVVVVTSYCLWRTVLWDWQTWNLPAYLFPRTRIIMGFVVVPFQFLVVTTVGLLWLRVFKDIIDGQTQIEAWEQERLYALSKRHLIPPGRGRQFPFDLGMYDNIVEQLGGLVVWLLPWSRAPGTGHVFKKAFKTQQRWPPETRESREHEYYRADRWRSWEGENLADFGVDIEDSDNVPLADIASLLNPAPDRFRPSTGTPI